MTGRGCLGFCSVMVFAVAGCDTATDLSPVLSGRVALYNELGHQLSSADGVRVTALTPSSIKPYQTFTDGAGRFHLELPEGEFVPVHFSREGFGDMFRFHVEEEIQPIQVGLFARSSAEVVGVDAVAEACGAVDCLRLTLDVDHFFGTGTTRRIFRLYLSTDPEVSSEDYQITDLLVVPNDQPGLVQTGSKATFEMDGLHGLLGSFETGATVHVVVHGATENTATSYPSPQNGLAIFTDVSEVSARASFVIP